MSKKYKLELSFVQSTGGAVDDRVVVSEWSDDAAMHVIKTKVFSKHLSAAIAAITEEMCDIGLAAMSGK